PLLVKANRYPPCGGAGGAGGKIGTTAGGLEIIVRRALPVNVGNTRTSRERLLFRRRDGASGTRTNRELTKLKAFPTFPGEKSGEAVVATPSLRPAPSTRLFSPRHQLTNPFGIGVQGGRGTTASNALELVTEPTALVTITE